MIKRGRICIEQEEVGGALPRLITWPCLFPLAPSFPTSSAPFALSDWPFPPALPVTCRAMPLAVKEERTRGIAAACCLLSSSLHDSPLLSVRAWHEMETETCIGDTPRVVGRGCGNRALPNHYKHSGHSHRTKFRGDIFTIYLNLVISGRD